MPGKILIVDDDSSTLESTSALLEDEGHKVLVSQTAFGVITLINKEKPDLLLPDVDMPGLRGSTFVKDALRHAGIKPGELKILLHSGRAAEDLARLVEECGVDGYIEKSIPPDLMLAKIDHHLSYKRL